MKLPRSRVPAAVRAVAREERRLAWGMAEDGTPLVATPAALFLGEERLPWTSVERISWVPDVLTVVEVAEVEATGRTRAFVLAEDSRLAEIVRARVTSSVVWSDRRALGNDRHVRVVGRRVPGQDALLWQAVWESSVDASDSRLRAAVEAQLEELRKTLG